MSLNTFAFLLFLPAVLLAYECMSLRWRWVVVAVASGLFVALTNLAVVPVLSFAILVAYLSGLTLERTVSRNARRAALMAGLLLLLGPLALTRHAVVGWIATVGMSFYTLRLASYVIDIHARRIPAERNLGVLAAYAAFFPEFLAGPIDRAGSLIPQIRTPKRFDATRVSRGLKRFTWGIIQKSVVADQLGLFVDPVFANPSAWGGVSLSLASVLYAFQILYDFAGYSDMAIGVGEILGFRLAPNFDHPYCAKSVSEFWRRWHISLSSWLRDYIFLPLAYPLSRVFDRLNVQLSAGGQEQAVYAIATLATMTVAGMWHGSGWHFVVWGTLIGSYMAVSRATRRIRSRLTRASGLARTPKVLGAWRIILVFVLMDVAWVFFRARSVNDALYVLRHAGDGVAGWAVLLLASPFAAPADWASRFAPLLAGNPTHELVLACVGIAGVEAVRLLQRRRDLYLDFMALPGPWRWIAYYGAVLIVLALGHFERSAFIYAQF